MDTARRSEALRNPRSRRAVGALAALALLAVPAAAIAAKAGELDGRFGGNGTVLRDLGVDERGTDVVVQADRKVVTASTVTFRRNSAVQINRFEANGRIDKRFGNEGRRILALPGDEFDPSLALADRGRIVVSFHADTDGAPIGVARLTRRGAPDRSFDGDGLQTVGYGAGVDSYESPVDLALAPDGGIVAVGSARQAGPGSRPTDFAAVRLDSDGSLDETFGDGGRALIDAGGYERARAVAIDAAGRIAIAGESEPESGPTELALARLTAGGTPDGGFGGDGSITSPLMRTASDVVALPGGALGVAGTVSGDFGAVRFAEDGSPDPSFSGDGLATVDFVDSTDSAAAIARDGERLVVAGRARTARRGYDFGIVRLRADGVPDRSFDDDGRRAVDFEKTNDEAGAVAVDGRGSVVAAGEVMRRSGGDDNYDTGIVRLLGKRR